MTRYAIVSAGLWKNTGHRKQFGTADDPQAAERLRGAQQAATCVDVVVEPVEHLGTAAFPRTEAA